MDLPDALHRLFIPLPQRVVLVVGGAERESFLHRLLTQEIRRLAVGEARLAALLTPQGKVVADMLVAVTAEAFLLEMDAAQFLRVRPLLERYRLRAAVSLAPAVAEPFTWFSAVIPHAEGQAAAQRLAAAHGGVAFADPRWPTLGVRVLLPVAASGLDPAPFALRPAATEIYTAIRVQAAVPEGEPDLPAETLLAREAGLDRLQGLSWNKGCFIGQEVTTRTRVRGHLRRCPFGVRAAAALSALPPPGTPVQVGEKVIGALTSCAGAQGLALLRRDDAQAAMIAQAKVQIGAVPVFLFQPPWQTAGEQAGQSALP